MDSFTKFWLAIAIIFGGALVLLYYVDEPLEHYSVSISLPIDITSHSGEATYYGVDAVFNADTNIPFGMVERQIASAGTNPDYWIFNPYEISQPINVTFPTTRTGSLTVTIHYYQKQQYMDGGGSTVTRWVTLPSYTYTVRIDPYREAK